MITQQKGIMWAGIVLILITGLVHLQGAQDSFDDATYKGVLFVANGIGAIIAAIGIYRGEKSWGWGLGLLVAAGALVAYIMSRTVGLPSLEAEPDAWFEPMGVVSLIAEGLFTALAACIFTKQPETGSNSGLKGQLSGR